MKKHRIFTTSFASVYPHYVQKAEVKGRKRQELDELILLADRLHSESACGADRTKDGL
jgi:hypothetical protein